MSSENETSNPPQPNINGDTILGNVQGSTNVVVGKDINATFTTNVIAEEQAYNVHGLDNPYLGLRAFTYAERTLYAGREQTAQDALEKLTAPGAACPLLFITGASGSGKSSFAQAAPTARHSLS